MQPLRINYSKNLHITEKQEHMLQSISKLA